MAVAEGAGDRVALIVVLARVVPAVHGLKAILATELHLKRPVAATLDVLARHGADGVGRLAVLAVGGTVAREAVGDVQDGAFGAGGASRHCLRGIDGGGTWDVAGRRVGNRSGQRGKQRQEEDLDHVAPRKVSIFSIVEDFSNHCKLQKIPVLFSINFTFQLLTAV